MYAHMSSYMRTIFKIDPGKCCFSDYNYERRICSCTFYEDECIFYLTYYFSYVISIPMTTPAKKKALLGSGTLNPDPEAVRSELFKLDFFDPCDRAQVKYEMLRAHSVDGDPIAEACRHFGFSRESFYQIERAFRELGFSSLLPEKRGRKGPVKLKGEVLEFALEKKKEDPDIDPGRLAALIRERYGTDLHRTTVMRGIKKKLHSSA
jgi:transposase